MLPVLPRFVKQKHTADKAAVVTGAVVIYAVGIHANGAAADVELVDAVTDTASDELMYSALDGADLFFDYTPLGGVIFNTGLTVDITGVGATLFLWTDRPQVTA